MPVNKHLNWVDLTDFSKGLYDEQSSTKQLLGPSGALVICTDYEPRVEGGLRAFFKGAALTTSGLTSPTTAQCLGIWANAGLSDRTGISTALGYDRLISYIGSDFKARVGRMDGTNDETTWKSAFLDGVAGSQQASEHTEFALFKTTAGVLYGVWVQRAGGAKGVYTIQFDYTGAAGANGDGTVTKRQTFQGPITVSQARILMADSTIIYYTDTGDVLITSTSTQQVIVAPNRPNAKVSMLHGNAPSDLLVGFQGAPWYAVQGDISNTGTAIREMGDDHHQRTHYQHPVRVPGGIAFIEPGGRIYITDGRTFRSVSDQIAKFAVDVGNGFGPGQLAFADHYLFAPGGHVHDLDTGAWFKSSLLTDSAFHFFDGSGSIYMANAATGISLAIQRIFEGGDATVTRCSSATIQTIPFRDAAGRDVRIQEVQIDYHAYVTSTITVSILDSSGNTLDHQSLTVAAGTTMASFLFSALPDRYESVKVATSADDGSSETVTIEAVRIGFSTNNNIVGQPD